MPHASSSIVVPAPVDRAWSVVRLFDGLPAWHPVIASSSLDSGVEGEVGAVRRLTTADGAVIVERLLELDDDEHRLQYTILEGPFPVDNYVSTMQLRSEDDGTAVDWTADFECAPADEVEMTKLFGEGVFGTGLAALRDHVGREAS